MLSKRHETIRSAVLLANLQLRYPAQTLLGVSADPPRYPGDATRGQIVEKGDQVKCIKRPKGYKELSSNVYKLACDIYGHKVQIDRGKLRG